MSEKDDGGPAFPMPMTMMTSSHIANEPEYGMTLRDYLAVHASEKDIDMQRQVGECNGTFGHYNLPDDWRAIARYMHADAMLKERAK